MARKNRTSDRESGVPVEDEVVRLPVPESDLADQLGEMPSPKRRLRLQPTPAVDLTDEELEDPIVHTPADMVMVWEDEESDRRQSPMGWLVLIGVVLMGLGGWALAKLATGEVHLGEQAKLIDAGWQEEERRRLDAMGFLDRLAGLTRAYLGAQSAEEKAKYVRQPERVFPLMQAYYERHPIEPVEFERIRDLKPIGIEHRPFFLIEVDVEGDETRPLFLEELADGEVRFDWESEVAYQPMELGDYIAEKPVEPMDFRVYARWDSKGFYGFGFDSERYRVLLLRARNTEEFLFGYVLRGSELEAELEKIFEAGKPKKDGMPLSEKERLRRKDGMPIMLRMRFLAEPRSRRSVLVEKVVAPRWVYVEPPEDEKALPGPETP